LQQICEKSEAPESKLERDSAFILELMRDASLSHHQASVFSIFWRRLMNERIRVMQRQPRRISITLSYHVHEALLTRSEEEGRSVSNLCAFLLEDALRDPNRSVMAMQQPLPQANSAFSGNGARPKTRSF
jgi:macrodomain Ter protein organizer (MatP/YcbG family)